MIAFLPVSRYKVEYQVAAGRPYSIFERLLLEAVASCAPATVEDLAGTFRVHRRVVIEGLVTLMQAGWVALEQTGQGVAATAAGRAVVERPGELPKNIIVLGREDFLVGERVQGQLARGRDVTFTPRSELAQHWEQGVVMPKGAIPHPLEPGLVVPLLRRERGEWIRGCDAINVVRDGADFVVVDVDTEKGILTGIPDRWKLMLEEELLERARKKERELMRAGKVPEDRALRKFVRAGTTQAEKSGVPDPDEWSISLPSERLIVGSDAHHAILEDRLESARSYVAIASGKIEASRVERLERPLRAAVARGVLIDILWDVAPKDGDRASHQAGLDLLRKIEWDSRRATGGGRLILGKAPSRSHAKLLVSDAGREVEAIVGSYDWLAGDGGSSRLDLSLVLVEPGPVGRLCQVLADLAALDDGLSRGAGLTRLRTAAANLDRRMVEDEGQQGSMDEPASGKVSARLVLGRRHHTLLRVLGGQARERLIVGTHRWGPSAEVGFRELSRALGNACPRVEVHYGMRRAELEDEPLAAEFEKRGGALRHTPELHAKFAVCDDDLAVITSFNWLAPEMDRAQPSAGEIGFVLQGARMGARLLERLRPVIAGAYVTRAEITNLRSIERFVWEVPLERAPGWHVLVGDNGAGKSTILRAIALALVGADEAARLRQEWSAWLRDTQTSAAVAVTVVRAASTGDPNPGDTLKIAWTKTEEGVALGEPGDASASRALRRDPGFFSAAYGPFRRFTGGDAEYEKDLATYPALTRHLSMFEERVALTEGLAWLKDLYVGKLEKDRVAALFLERVQALINESSLLPSGVELREVTRAAVVFEDAQGHHFSIEELSDGYRSILSLTLDILRQMSIAFGPTAVFDPRQPGIVIAPGVVLIDEVDAHLHLSWQRTVGQWFCDHFPRVQFIVASHSPFVCQAAERGTVWRLPSPSLSYDEGGKLEGPELDRLVYGNILEALASGAFGEDIGRSESGKRLLRRLTELNQQELLGSLSEGERAEQQRLRTIFAVSPHLVASKDPVR